MSKDKLQAGFIHLGIVGLLFLSLAVFAGSKLASNPDLTFFNIEEKASGRDIGSCGGCSGKYEFYWNTDQNECKKKLSKNCSKDGASEKGTACSGECVPGIKTCTTKGLANIKGDCRRGSICCGSSSGGGQQNQNSNSQPAGNPQGTCTSNGGTCYNYNNSCLANNRTEVSGTCSDGGICCSKDVVNKCANKSPKCLSTESEMQGGNVVTNWYVQECDKNTGNYRTTISCKFGQTCSNGKCY